MGTSTAIELGDIVWLAVTTVIASYQMATFAEKVGKSRRKFKITPPTIDGDPEFVRTFRAQQNCIEFFAMYLGILWVSGLFFHQIPASLAGLFYCYGRLLYFDGYVQEAEKRVPGFYMCVNALKAMLGMGFIGIAHCCLHSYFGINCKLMLTGLFGY